MADEERLAGVLGLAAPLQAAVQAAVQGKPTAEALAWLSGAQRKLEADSKGTRPNAPSNKRCTAECLAPALAQLMRAADWAAALCGGCTASPDACVPGALLDAALLSLPEGAERWRAVQPAFVDVVTKLRGTAFTAGYGGSEMKLAAVIRIASNLLSSKEAGAAYAAHAAASNEWVPPAQQVPAYAAMMGMMGMQPGQMIPRGKQLEETGILGVLFSKGLVPDAVRKMHTPQHQQDPMYPWMIGEVGEFFFPEPAGLARQRSQQATSEVEMIGAQLREVQQEQTRVIKALLRKDTATREPTLDWLCAAVEVNESRGFEFKPHHNDSSDNFTTNLAFVLLRLAEPLTKDDSKVASINPLYALSGKRYIPPPNREGKVNVGTYDDETKFALASSDLDSWVDKRNLARIQAFDALRMAREARATVDQAEEDGMDTDEVDKEELAMAIQMSLEQPEGADAAGGGGGNFATECFFMTARALHHSLIPSLKASHNMNVQHGFSTYMLLQQNLGRAYQATQMAQAAAGQNSPEFGMALEKFGQLLACKNLFDAAMLDAELLGLAMSFYALMARWLLRMATGRDAAEVAQLALPLPLPPPMEFAALPEHFGEDLCEFLLLLNNWKPEVLERATDSMHCVLNLMVTLLASSPGTSGYVRNPYLRAKFVAVIHSLLPKDEEELRRTGSHYTPMDMSGVLLANQLSKTHLVESLLQVYVDLENTGSHNQFHEKFKPREQIYTLLSHLCDTTEAGGAAAGDFPKSLLTFLGRVQTEPTGTPAQFLSYLLNDTIVVFESALGALKKIKGLEAEEEGYESLPEEERETKKKEIEQERGNARHYLKQVDKTLHFLGYVTAVGPAGVAPFLAAEMVDRMAGMLNAFVAQLFSKTAELKIQKEDKVPEWQPKELLLRVLRVCAHLHAHAHEATATPAGEPSPFVAAVVADGRYSAAVYAKAEKTLTHKLHGGDVLVAQFKAFVASHSAASAAEIDLDAEDVPDEFLDPIMATLMSDPVTLPCG